jgi:competence protein ComEA
MFRNLIISLLAALSFSAFAAIDANRASQADLETVKGIGPGLSTKIVEARKTSAFKDWADLLDRVSGVGPGNAAKFSSAGLTVAGSPFQKTAAMEPAPKPVKSEKTEKAAAAKPAKSDAQPKPAK